MRDVTSIPSLNYSVLVSFWARGIRKETIGPKADPAKLLEELRRSAPIRSRWGKLFSANTYDLYSLLGNARLRLTGHRHGGEMCDLRQIHDLSGMEIIQIDFDCLAGTGTSSRHLKKGTIGCALVDKEVHMFMDRDTVDTPAVQDLLKTVFTHLDVNAGHAIHMSSDSRSVNCRELLRVALYPDLYAHIAGSLGVPAAALSAAVAFAEDDLRHKLDLQDKHLTGTELATEGYKKGKLTPPLPLAKDPEDNVFLLMKGWFGYVRNLHGHLAKLSLTEEEMYHQHLGINYILWVIRNSTRTDVPPPPP